MTDKRRALLAQMDRGPVVWISVSNTTSDSADFGGKTGWLRFMGDADSVNLVAGTLPPPDDRVLMSGEWGEGNATVSARRRGDTIELRRITEGPEGAHPVLRHKVEALTRAVPGNPGKWMRIAVYTGFRSDLDAVEGRLTTIAERFIGFSDHPLPQGAA
jgi:hypothetical protein